VDNLIRRLDKIVSFLEGKLTFISGLSIFLMMLLITFDVLGRNLFNHPLVGAQEITEMLMVVTVYCGIAYTQRENGHVGMDLLITKVYKGAMRKIALTIILILAVGVNILVSYFTFQNAIDTYHKGVVSIYLMWPVWFLPLFVSIGSIILSARLFVDWLDELFNTKNIDSNSTADLTTEEDLTI
jgi:TRAP-type C4-dicarboxylate transport system permease small subunit